MDGVEDAKVSYEQGQGVVTYDPEITSPEAMIEQLTKMAGYRASVVE